MYKRGQRVEMDLQNKIFVYEISILKQALKSPPSLFKMNAQIEGIKVKEKQKYPTGLENKIKKI